MVKNQTKYQILREYSESDVRALGMSYIGKKRGKLWCAAITVSSVFALVGIWIFDDSKAWVSVLPLPVVYGAFWWSGLKTGKKILEYVKTHPQPVKLDF